jgi:hypothetical protein
MTLTTTITAIAVGALLAATPAKQTIYRSRSDVVVIDVAVADGRRPITTLTKEDFELRDNGVVQRILDFDHGQLPLDVTLTIDISGSMTEKKRAAVVRAVGQVSGALGPSDRGTVVTFGRGVTRLTPLQHPPIAVNLSANGLGTSIYDAVLLSLVTAPILDRRQLNVVMTDADDTTSYFDAGTVIDTARHAANQLSFVIVRGGGTDQDDEVMDAFRAIARTTGGEVIRIDQDDALSEAFMRALQNFRLSYLLRYSPEGVAKPGWHDVTVTVKKKNYTVRARRGYFQAR